MTELKSPDRWRRRFLILLALWLVCTFAFSLKPVRALALWPLTVNDPAAEGEAVYILADGYASYERLHAATDLFHWGRVKRIMILDEKQGAGYYFAGERSETRGELMSRCLQQYYGVPADKITMVPMDHSTSLGTLSEARAVAAAEKDIKRLVIVTSAPHTRRSRLAFRRVLPDDVEIQVYPASSAYHSAENYSPIWLEYVKLLVYYFAA